MLRYTAHRLFWLFPVLFGIGMITFVLMHAVPGGPWDANKKLPPQTVANLNHRYNLDDSLLLQYGKFLSDTVRGDLGISYTNQDRDVTQIIRQGLPATALLAGLAFLISVAGGFPLEWRPRPGEIPLLIFCPSAWPRPLPAYRDSSWASF